jgi:serine phosphatase RsbU (regulator of sigma subunit)
MTSDGYADQFGGTQGKKFMTKRLKELLLSIHHRPMIEQWRLLTKTIDEWRGNKMQVDDILVIGIRV